MDNAAALRHQATAFGFAAFMQKLALGLGVGLFGIIFDTVSYRAGAVQTPGALAGMRALLLGVPAAGLLLSGWDMFNSPLRRQGSNGQQLELPG